VAVARRLIGITGCPGAGKSTLAARLAAASQDPAVVVPMDGFHLAQSELARLGRADRKGAPDTFDIDGFIALLDRIRRPEHRTIWAPRFDRQLEEPVAGAIAIEPGHRLVIVEGNYLLHRDGGWAAVRDLLDACWYAECDDETRRARLAGRHVGHGRSPAEASRWVRDVDEPNAQLIRACRERADRIIGTDGRPSPDMLRSLL
jgi:pantothenate kinase